MDERLAVQRPHTENSTVAHDDWIQESIYRPSHPFSSSASRLRKTTTPDGRRTLAQKRTDCNAFTGSLAEVYEKALNNVLNIQPKFKMEENVNEKLTLSEKKPIAASDTLRFLRPEHSRANKRPCLSLNDTRPLEQKASEGKTINASSKSAFHVPEKRRTSSNQSRYSNWPHDHTFPYPVNYPGDYYPVYHPPPFYTRPSPYDNLYLDRFNYYPGPRRREFPVFTHVLPWLQVERDVKPQRSAKFDEWRPNESVRWPKHDMANERTVKKARNDRLQHVVPRTLCGNEKSAVPKEKKCEGSKTSDHKVNGHNGLETSSKSPSQPDSFKVKTRRMRANEKRKDFSSENGKESFDSPKEEFLFHLGLTRVH